MALWVTAHGVGFRIGGKHLDPMEAVALRGAAVETDLRPARLRRGGVSSPLDATQLATRVLEGCSRRGARPNKRVLCSGALGPLHRMRREPRRVRVARWPSGYPPRASARGSSKARARAALQGTANGRREASLAQTSVRRGRGSLEFTDEDGTLGGCARASYRVAEVDRRRLAQRGASRIHSNRVPEARGRGLARRQASTTYRTATARKRAGLVGSPCAQRNAENRLVAAKPRDRGKPAPELGVGDGPRA